ncbi:MAG: serine hydrolase [Ignavibacteriales bacterium]|nr:serine hydrolase [Ignavibacteriales bacterium]
MKTTIYFSLILALSSNIAKSQEIPISKIENDLNHQIEKILEETGIPSVSYSIFSSDSVILCNAIGHSNVKFKVPATKETIYNTGSTFKIITAMCIMQLQGEKQLDIDTPIRNYLHGSQYSDYNENNPVTLRHLLSHRSGLNGVTIKIPIWEKNLPETLDSLANKIVPYEKPGVEFKYCNHCFGLAGYILQNVTNKPYNDYVKDNILMPLDIKGLEPFYPTPEMMERMALPYHTENNIPIPTNFYRYNVFPAGDAYFTPTDMAKILITQLNNGKYKEVSILDSILVQEIQTNQFTPNNYGLGVGITINNDGKLLLHGGDEPGFSSYFILDTRIKKGIYVMANCGNSSDILLALSNRAILLMRGEKPENDLPNFAKKEFKEIVLDNNELKKYEGKYQLAPQVFMEVSLEEENLHIQVSGQQKVKIFPYEENKFFMKVTDAQITFNLDEKENIESLTLFQKGRSIIGQKNK